MGIFDDIMDAVGGITLGPFNPAAPMSPLNPLSPVTPNPKTRDTVTDIANDLAGKDQVVKLSDLLTQTGWRGTDKQRARGMVYCESKGDEDAVNETPCATGENAVGLTQICTVHRGTMGIPRAKPEAVEYLKNPKNNLAVARALQRREGWGPWAASAACHASVPTNWNPEITLKNRTLTDTVIDPLTAPFEAIAGFFGLLSQANTWLRIGKVIIGIGLIGAGVIAIVIAGGKVVGTSKAGKAAIGITPVGRGLAAKKAVATGTARGLANKAAKEAAK